MPTPYEDLLAQARDLTPAVTLDALAARLATSGAPTVIDVREGEEFRAGHIPGAVHLPRGHLEARASLAITDRDAELLVYCAAGPRAALASRTLVELGYSRVSRLEPGFAAWKARGLPVVIPGVLTEDQRDRYARHLRLPEVGEAGQRALLDARVLLVGVGGLGSPVALYLAAAGVGTLGLVDADVVDASNLQRQVIHATTRVGWPKVDSAEEALTALNPAVRVVKHRERLTAESAARLIEGYALVVDGSDNLATRYAVNDAAVRAGVPLVHGSVHRFEGQVTTVIPGEGACYRCVFPRAPAPGAAMSCDEVGVLGVLPGLVGVLQATEALKLLLKLGEPLAGRLLTVDALAMRFREIKVPRDPACECCGAG